MTARAAVFVPQINVFLPLPCERDPRAIIIAQFSEVV